MDPLRIRTQSTISYLLISFSYSSYLFRAYPFLWLAFLTLIFFPSFSLSWSPTLSPFWAPAVAQAEPIRVTDDRGRVVSLPSIPARIISLAPSVTEMLFALGLDREIVGVTTLCDYPPQAQTKASVGSSMTPDLEKIVALKPDLVITARGVSRAESVREIERLHFPVFVTNHTTVEAVFGNIRDLGELTGKAPESKRLIGQMHSKMNAIQKRLSGRLPLRVLYILWHDPLLTVGPGSFIHELIEMAGGKNIYLKKGAAYARYSLEDVIAQNPEVILFTSEIGEAAIRVQKREWKEKWKILTAVQKNRLHTVSSDLLHRPGPRIVEGLEALALAIHPEAFHGDAEDAYP